jgi:hypothetical protein
MRLGLVGTTLAALVTLFCATSPSPAADQISRTELSTRLARLEAQVTAGEDIRAIKKLQRAYGYYVDKGLWEDLAKLFTEDAVANYPAGTFIGRASIREHLYMNVGGHNIGDLGLGDGRLYDHMNIQPVVHLLPDGKTAKGRWRAFAMFGTFGGPAVWAEGIYEMTYVKEKGTWKIQRLDYFGEFGAPYQTGWTTPAETGPQTRPAAAPRKLAHPADRERDVACDGFPKACIEPFHYENPGRSAASAAVWTITDTDEALRASSGGNLRFRVTELAHRAQLLRDGQDIENLQRIYGYYLDRAMWDQVADLFADDGTIEEGQQGVYVGKRRVREFLSLMGPHGLTPGWLNDHIQLQILVDVAPDGLSASARSRELAMTGHYQGSGTWSEGVYENTFVKDHGVWKFKSLHFFPTFISDYDKGWGKDAQPVPTASTQLPPDRPPTQTYEIYPKAHVPPFHFPNPVTGEPEHYPKVGGPSPKLAATSLNMRGMSWHATAAKDVAATLNAAEHDIQRVKDYDELENLESAYGYYLDKNLWNDLADLFARDGSIELAQRGVYRGQDHVRAFLLKVFGRGEEGPVAGRLGNHLQVQPVIDVAPDGQHGFIRVRLLQQMSFGSRAALGGGVYENEVVKEGGIWKLKVDHVYNTFTAAYEGGWAHGASTGMPGPSTELPPDAPPSAKIAMFPVVYDIPFHYANPVTGRTEVPALAPQEAAGSATNTPAGAMPMSAPPGMSPEAAATLREIGTTIEGPRTTALYTPLFPKEPYPGVVVKRDISYGPHERHVLDVFTTPGRPVTYILVPNHSHLSELYAVGTADESLSGPVLAFVHEHAGSSGPR